METVSQGQKLFLTRLTIGLAQGLVLYLLYSASDAKAWPATQGTVFIPLLLVSLSAPIGLILSLGTMSCRKSLIWVGIAGTVVALLGFFDSWMGASQVADVALPSVQLMLFGAGGLFIAHALVTGGVADGRFMASYPTHFDVAWKLAVQMALSVLFVGAFWLLMWLGAGLFGLIKLDFLRKASGTRMVFHSRSLVGNGGRAAPDRHTTGSGAGRTHPASDSVVLAAAADHPDRGRLCCQPALHRTWRLVEYRSCHRPAAGAPPLR